MNRGIATLGMLVGLLLPGLSLCANKSAVEPQVLSLPKGPGSIDGLGESFAPQLNTGTAAYRINLAVPPGVNGQQPKFGLLYNGGYGNSILGIGWRLDFPWIARQTDKGLPHYTNTDTFIHSDGGELVPLADGFFRLKIEGDFIKAQRKGDGWEVWERDGTHHDLGTTADSWLETPNGSFEWHLDRSVDTNGNTITYLYEKAGGRVYLAEVRYSLVAETRCKSIHLIYEDRPDPFTDYHSRSLVLTTRRLAAIEMRSQGVLMRKYRLEYVADSELSLLARVIQVGADDTNALPPISFDYSSYDPRVHRVSAMSDPPPVALSDPNLDLVDIDGDGLPDLVYTESWVGKHRFYLNQGRGAWAPGAETPAQSPQYFLESNGVMMSDMNGDGLADLFVKTRFDFGFFRNRGQLAWDESDWTAYEPMAGFSFEDANCRMLDLNNDKLIDVIRSVDNGYQVWLNPGDHAWNDEFDAETVLPHRAWLGFTSPNTKLGDMNGDRMEDLVFVQDGYVSYFPSKGHGEFDAEVEVGNPPHGYEPAEASVTDLNNDGLADLVVVSNEHVRVWLNGGNEAFKSEILLENTPGTVGTSGYRFADIDGDGVRDLLVTNQDARAPYQTVSFNAGVHPNLLTRIRNGLGQETRIDYRSSIEDYLRDRDAGNPWSRKLPFPVQVVSRVTVRDNNSGQEYMTDYRYRDGYYDGAEKEFRGFGQVTKIEQGGPGAPGVQTSYNFDVGDTQESRKGMALSQTVLETSGTISPPVGLFEVADHGLTTRTLATGTNGVPVSYSFTNQTDTRIFEGTANPVTLRHAWDQDDYGNTIADLDYGIVVGTDLGAGGDEVLTYTDYQIDAANWIVNRPSRVRKTDLADRFVSLQRLTYDTKGNLTLDERSPDGQFFIPVAAKTYDGFGNVLTITDANGHWRGLEYDQTFHAFPVRETIGGLGLTMAADYELGLGLMTGFTDPNGQTTGFGYDTFGRLTRIVKPGDSAALPTQTFEYRLADPVSAIVTRSREQSGQPGTYDSLSWFDGLGRKLQTRSEGAQGDWVVGEAAVFNQRRGIARQWLPHFAASPDYADPDAALPHTDLAYDARGRSVHETNPDGTFRSTRYRPLTKVASDEEDNRAGGPHADTPHTAITDGRQRLIEVREVNGAATYVTHYGYDGQDNLARIEDDQGNVKTLTFDGLGRKTRMEDPDKGLMTYVYDGVGNLLGTTDAKGQTIAYTYDPANRTLTEASGDTGVQVRYHYDTDLPPGGPALQNTQGRLAWIEDQAGREAYSYDARGNVSSQIRHLNGLDFITRMDHDAQERLTRLTYPDGTAVGYTYNAMGKLAAVPDFVTAIDYAPTGQKSAFTYANGVQSTYGYDDRQRLAQLRSTRSAAVLQDFTYDYDGVSNIRRITDRRPAKTPEDRSADYGYDDLYRLIQATAPAWTEGYRYDSIGNMTFKSDLGVMTYGAGSAGPHALTGAAGIGYGYDANGNLAAKQGFDYRFDYRDRLARVDRTADGAVIDYAYDSGFDRKRKTVTLGGQSQTTLYVDRYTELRGDRLVKQVFVGDRLVARVSVAPFRPSMLAGWNPPRTALDLDVNPQDGVISLDELRAQGANPALVEPDEAVDALRIYQLQRQTNPELLPFATLAAALHEHGTLPPPVASRTLFYLSDHLGSASAVMDTRGGLVEESVFYPYGKDRVRTGGYESEYRFTGKELDGETGLHYFGARYYDSTTGRFVSVDPIFSEHSYPYAYAIDNPLKNTDPLGLFSFTMVGVVALQFAASVGEVLTPAMGTIISAASLNIAGTLAGVTGIVEGFNEADKQTRAAGVNLANAFRSNAEGMDAVAQSAFKDDFKGQGVVDQTLYNHHPTISAAVKTVNLAASALSLADLPSNISQLPNVGRWQSIESFKYLRNVKKLEIGMTAGDVLKLGGDFLNCATAHSCSMRDDTTSMMQEMEKSMSTGTTKLQK